MFGGSLFNLSYSSPSSLLLCVCAVMVFPEAAGGIISYIGSCVLELCGSLADFDCKVVSSYARFLCSDV